ncbi:MAG: sulfite exporter TauE/SafE family protein [Chloroflexi bacterium]|nr:sulfite exporter TauE/SafE family protein [Chloroflexota bacterium]
MNVFLPIADMSVSLPLMVGIGVLIGFLSGMFGVGGGFLLTPLLMMTGIPSTVAVGSVNAQMVATTASGAYAHSRMGNVDIKLGILTLAGGLIGSTIGVQIVKILNSSGSFDSVLRITYIIMLSIIGIQMLREGFQATRQRITEEIKLQTIKELLERKDFATVHTQLVGIEHDLEEHEQTNGGWRHYADRLPLQTYFTQADITTSALLPLGLGVVVGLLAALMGVGGGFILMPTLIYILGVRTILAVGTSLFQTFFLAINTAFQQAWQNHAVDLVLVFLLFAGSTVGAQIGSQIGSRVQGPYLRLILAVIVLAVMLKILVGDLLMPPAHVISIVSIGAG